MARVIDFHTHVRTGQGRVEDFIQAMAHNGIDMAVVAPIIPAFGEGESTNEQVRDLVQRYPDRLIGLACVIPYHDDAAQLLEYYIREFGFRGLKLHPPIQNFYPSDPKIFPVIRKAIELDIPILIHTGTPIVQTARGRFGDPQEIDDLALAFPEAKIVIAHGEPLGLGARLAAKHPNVYMDTAVAFVRTMRVIPAAGIEAFRVMAQGKQRGGEKIIFGSDANLLKTYRFKETLESIYRLEISEQERNMILGGNAARLLKFDL